MEVWATFTTAFVAVVTAVFSTVVATLKASYESSHKWFAIGCGIFVVLLYFGYVHMKVPAHDDDLAKQVASLSQKLDTLSGNIDALKMPAAAPAVMPKKIVKLR